VPNKKIYIWIAGITLLLVSLVTIQLIWLRQAAVMEQRETKLHVIKALERAEEKLKNTNYCMITYSKLYLNPNEGFYMLHTLRGKTDTVHTFTNDEAFTHTDTMLYDIPSINTQQYPVTVDMQLRLRMEVGDTGNFYKEQEEFYHNTGSKRVADKFAASRAIDSLFDMVLLDSLIGGYLKSEGTGANYGFGFIDNNHSNVVYARRVKDTTALLQSQYAINIFTDNKFLKPHKLSVVFMGGQAFYRTNYWLISSVFIIVLLAASFFVFVKLYFGQVKLTEMKSDFINNLTHEFNTPIANISLAIETLEGDGAASTDKVDKILGIISVEAARLRDNIEKALQVTAMDKGEMQMHKEETDLVALVTTILSSYQMQCEQLGGRINYLHPEQVLIGVDETHFLNCVCNLLDNAIKYRNGIPLITITLQETPTNVTLVIADNGIGMGQETQKHIFEKFYRAHEGDVHNMGGNTFN
jgi:signal transduction histidine kinase